MLVKGASGDERSHTISSYGIDLFPKYFGPSASMIILESNRNNETALISSDDGHAPCWCQVITYTTEWHWAHQTLCNISKISFYDSC